MEKRIKIQDPAPNVPCCQQICKLFVPKVATSSVCGNDAGTLYLAFKYHVRNMPKSDCAVKLQRMCFGTGHFGVRTCWASVGAGDLPTD